MKQQILFLVPLVMLATSSHAGDLRVPPGCEIIIDDFAAGIKAEWLKKSFHGQTDYTWVRENGHGFIRASSQNAASGLVYKIRYDPKRYPFITWSWKVDKMVADSDVTLKSKDDYSARIYIVFPSLFFWNTKTINYFWADKFPVDKAVPSMYTRNSIMVSVESGPTHQGEWRTETRNIYDDYIRYFGSEPPDVGAIAIMTDTDDTGGSALADYGPIAACSRNPGK